MTTVAATRESASGRQHVLTGTWLLFRFALRRERIRTTVWIVGIALLVASTAIALPDLYSDPAERQARLDLMSNPAAIAMSGPLYDVDDYTIGAMLTNEMLGFTAVIVALMSIFIVVRHTRADEETGRTELVRANVVGRHAPLAAALAMAVTANVVLAVAMALSLGGAGIESVDWAGSWLFSTAIAMVGVVFAAVAAVTVQVAGHGRAASGAAGLALGGSFALRAAGDIGNDMLSWLSPIGWAQRTYAYVDDRWWPLVPGIILSVILIGVAVQLENRRDVGSGLRPASTGPAHAAEGLGSPFRLALRLQRGALIGWSTSLFAFGLLFGLLLADVEGFAAEVAVIEELIGEVEGVMTEAFLGMLAMLVGMSASIFALVTTLRARAEEFEGRAEPILATPSSRTRWFSSHLAIALGGSVLIGVSGGLGTGLSAASTMDDASLIGATLAASVVHLAPAVVIVGVAALLFGWVPETSGAAWLVVIYAITVGMLGGWLGVPEWGLNLALFTALPLLPVEEFAIAPVLILLGIGVALIVLGMAGFRRRDITTTA